MNAVAYARYSTDKQTDNSIAYQLNEIEKYCNNNNISLIATYIDEAKSGTNTNRNGFKQMLKASALGMFEAIVIYDISRGSRDVADWFEFRKEMEQRNIKVISATQDLGDIMNPDTFLTELINVGIGQHMVLQTRQKSMAGVASKAKKGAFLGGIPPFGYDIVNEKYVVNEYEANYIRYIFKTYADGKSYDYIIQNLKGLKGKRGKLMGKNSLHAILKNERYIGVYTWNKKINKKMGIWAGGTPNENCIRIEGAITPIIDNKTWERVQKRMSQTARAKNKAKREYLLSGLIQCDTCGSTYVGHTSTNSKGYETRYYCCGNKYRTKNCHNKNINANEIEHFVIESLREYLQTLDVNASADRIVNEINNASPNLSKEKKELADIEFKISNGMKAILGGMEFPELEDEVFRLRVRKNELEDVIKRNESTNPKVDKNKILEFFNYSINNLDSNLNEIINQNVRIYAHTDGSYDVSMGVHINNCGGRI